MINKINKKNRAFTLIEVLVSVGIFSIVILVALSSIVVFMDANKTGRSMSLVTNSLNFSLESITRAVKTGEILSTSNLSKLEVKDQDGQTIVFELNNNKILKNNSAITSPDVKVNKLNFIYHGITLGSDEQPRVTIIMQAEANVGGKEKSEFNIQTTVSQRKLKL